MELALHIANLGSGALMVLAILLQRRSAGIGSGVGGTDSGAYTATGGIDRLLVRSTIVLALVFFGSALGMLFV